jgi:hypothetical protein
MRKQRRRLSPATVISMLALFVALGAGSYAVGAIPGQNGRISACFQKKGGSLRVINVENGKTCKAGEKQLGWNQKGPKGARGVRGPAGPSTPQTIADGSIGTAKLADDAVTAAKIADNAVGSSQIVAGGVGSSEITAGGVGGSELGTGAVAGIDVLDHGLNGVDVSNFAGSFLNVDVATVPDGTCVDHDIAAAGVQLSDAVVATPSFIEAGLTVQPISATGEIRLRVCNQSAADINPNPRDYRIITFDTDG